KHGRAGLRRAEVTFKLRRRKWCGAAIVGPLADAADVENRPRAVRVGLFESRLRGRGIKLGAVKLLALENAPAELLQRRLDVRFVRNGVLVSFCTHRASLLD